MPYDRDPTAASPDLEDIVDFDDELPSQPDGFTWNDLRSIQRALELRADELRAMDETRHTARALGHVDQLAARLRNHLEYCVEEALEKEAWRK